MIELDIKTMLENVAKDVVRYAVEEAPFDTGDLRDSIRMSGYNSSEKSIDVFIDPARLGVSPKRQNVKRWNGMLYPELVHKGTKFKAANPFFDRALARVDISKMPGTIFKVVKHESD